MKKAMILMAFAMILALAGCHRNVQNSKDEGDKVEYFETPDDLFNAIGQSVNLGKDPKKTIQMVNCLVTEYPDYENNPVALFMLASFVYDEQLHDLDKARETYQRIMDEYPDTPFAADASIAITQVGMTPEELVKMFESNEKSEARSQE